MHSPPESDKKSAEPQAPKSTIWKFWLGIAMLIAFSIGVHYEKHVKQQQGRGGANWGGAVREIGEDACDETDRARFPEKCDVAAEEARARASRKFENYRP
jgi:hypothetical protein